MSSRVSPDGMYYWDGKAWVSTLSADGRHRWTGAEWVPVNQGGYVLPPPYGVASPTRQPTSWTRPLQYAVAGWYAWSIIYSLSIPFWMNGFTSQFASQFIAATQAGNPDVGSPSPGLMDSMNAAMTVGMWIGVVILAAIYLVPLIGAFRRWIWVYYTVVVLLGLSALLLPVDLFDVVVQSRLNTAAALQVPSSMYLVSFLTGLPGALLLAWMLVALFTRGPWAMRKVSC